MADQPRVVALLGTRWQQLEHHGTRWRAVLTRWSQQADVTVVDFPRFSQRALRPTVRPLPSWLPGTTLLDVTVPSRAPGAWSRTATRLAAAVPAGSAFVAATPLWAPVLPHLPGRRAFDAVDDWREHPAFTHLRAQVLAGYAVLPQVDVVTAVSAELAGRLRTDGVDPVVVRNGVDLAAYVDRAPAPAGLPDGPFAVYVGVVEDRVDLDLLRSTAAVLPVVVAGPVRPEREAALRSTGVTWLGPVPTGQVPGLLQRAAVGLVPHVRSSFTVSMDPMKVVEYLAAGLPVLSTPGLGNPAVKEAAAADFPVAARRLAALPRRPGPDPAVAHLDWDVVADRLLGLVLGHGGAA